MSNSIEERGDAKKHGTDCYERFLRTAALFRSMQANEATKLLLGRLSGNFDDKLVTVHTPRLAHPFQITASHSDIAIFSQVVGRKAYAIPEILRERIDGKPVVDIGSNIGSSSVYFATCLEGSTIFAYEPHDRNIDLLKRNAAPYRGQIQTKKAAVTPTRQTLLLQNGSGHRGSYRYDGKPKNLSTLDDECTDGITPSDVIEHVDPTNGIGIIKINIGGAERDLFDSGSMDQLMSYSDMLFAVPSERFAPRSSVAIQQAASRTGMVEIAERGEVVVYARSSYLP